MKTRKLGHTGPTVSALGLGTMSLTDGVYGPAPSRPEMIALIRKAAELGVTLFDTAEAYGPFINEELVGEALEPIRDGVVIATRFGFDIKPDGARGPGTNSQPAHIKQAVDAMLTRLAPTGSTCSINTASTPRCPSRTWQAPSRT